jgi:large subunit ribosomal protein L4
VHAIAVDQLNAYDVLVNDEVVFTSTAFDAYVSGPVSGKWAKAVATSTEVFDEPSNDELAASAVVVDEPSNEELAASAVGVDESSSDEVVASLVGVDESDADEPHDDQPYDELAASTVESSVDPSAEELSGAADTAASIVDVPEVETVVVEPPAADTYTEGKYGAGSYQGAEPPAGFDIKGNEDSMLFHTPDSPSYGETVAEVWFSSAEAAEVAGFAAANSGNADDEEESE